MSMTGVAAHGVLVPALLLLAFPACDFSLEDRQEFDLTEFDAPGAILDIGGGGEGVIGQLRPDQVIAIDISRDELEGAPAGPLKIVMDASDLKFLDESFETATSFCTMMYIDEKVHERVFEEMFRVLAPGGSFHIWDIAIPRRTEDSKETVLFPVSVKMPAEDVSTGYGVRRRDMDLDLDYYLDLARKAGFDVASREPSEQSFYLLLKKPADYVKPVHEETAQDHHLKPSDEQIEFYDEQDILVEDFEAPGRILDIGGGGAGVIGKLKGNRVMAIDISKRELEDAPAGPVKIVMDARDLQFLEDSFETVTSFFTLMYIQGSDHERVFAEIHRVLESGGRFFIWDVVLPTAPDEQKLVAVFPLRIRLPKEEIETGYGVHFAEAEQDLSYYLTLAERTGFRVVEQEEKERSLFLELVKP